MYILFADAPYEVGNTVIKLIYFSLLVHVQHEYPHIYVLNS